MKTCPKCNSPRITVIGGSFWTLECRDCGFTESGTASFSSVEEVELDYDLVFQLSSIRQIPIVRAIAPELLSRSSSDLLQSFRSEGSTITVPSLSMWRARIYMEKAEAEGIQARIAPEKPA